MRALTGLRRRWSVHGIYDNEWGNEQDHGVVETGHSGMHQVTGLSMLSCSFRWSRTLRQQANQEGVRQPHAQTLGGNGHSFSCAQALEA